MNRLTCTAAIACAMLIATPAFAQKAKTADFTGDAATAAPAAVTVDGIENLRGLKTVVIPQFTVDFVVKGDGLTRKQEKKEDYVSVDYRVANPDDATMQAITDRLYAAWVAGLQQQGLTVTGPSDAMALPQWQKLAARAKPAPAMLTRLGSVTRIYSAGGTPFLMPIDATEGPATGAAATAQTAVNTGGAVASKVGGKLGGMFGMAGGLMKMGKGLKGFGGAWSYAEAEGKLAKESGVAVMTVRLVVGMRDTDMATRGFGAFRMAGSYRGKPRLVVQSEGTQVTIVTPNYKRATLGVNRDLLFAEDLFAGKLEVANSAGATAANVANRALFLTAAVGGGSAAINQSHTFAVTPDLAAYTAAAERNLGAVQTMMLGRTASAW